MFFRLFYKSVDIFLFSLLACSGVFTSEQRRFIVSNYTSYVSASSHEGTYLPQNAFTHPEGWRAGNQEAGEFLRVFMRKYPRVVIGSTVSAPQSATGWIITYKLSYIDENDIETFWSNPKKGTTNFDGNRRDVTSLESRLWPRKTHSISLYPQTWHRHIQTRWSIRYSSGKYSL